MNTGKKQSFMQGALILAVAGLLVENGAGGVLHDVTEVTELEKAGTHGEIHAGDDHQHDQGQTPQNAVEPIQKIDHWFVSSLKFSLSTIKKRWHRFEYHRSINTHRRCP